MSETITPDQLSLVHQQALIDFETVTSLEHLQTFTTQTVGKKSELGTWFKQLKVLDVEAKKVLGPKLQEFKNYWETTCVAKQNELELKVLNEKLKSDFIDVTQTYPTQKGALHPLSQVQRHIETIFTGMGFEIADGPEVETEWHNFDALNVPANHPARDMQDTFFVSSKSDDSLQNSVLRTQTSNIQIRKMLENGAPVRLIAPGRVYRNEDVDATHDAMFYQVEGLVVDKDISVAHLKGTLEMMLSAVFDKEMKIRIRPGYFPFVEPGLEVDIWWEYTDKSGEPQGRWLEFCGAGMVHPNVLRNSNVDPEVYTGFAFGFGLTRLVMMKYGIEDIRLLASNKREFLQQF
jgi:phenylalanyl-tRNA synthetase alpha chain